MDEMSTERREAIREMQRYFSLLNMIKQAPGLSKKIMRLEDVLSGWKDGDEEGWEAAFARLWSEHTDRMDTMTSSIQEIGIISPILLGNDGRVWDGHHRLAAASKLGLDSVPVRVVDPEEK